MMYFVWNQRWIKRTECCVTNECFNENGYLHYMPGMYTMQDTTEAEPTRRLSPAVVNSSGGVATAS
eukprot:m.754934 g.754934  ORF g.754934 m.754934 type:complete len:66 (+) comp23178_c0_seq1:2-199(+)